MPDIECILCWVTQLQNGRASAFPEFYIELYSLHAVLVQVHELPPSSPSFCPNPLLVKLASAMTPESRIRFGSHLPLWTAIFRF
jgi:hypothetical protein